mmetsp:Transcript_18171/g.45117  ORF Transcript_18171/g.45117 Transcript_18171/m.45117 type:complete len:87 (+) Transcript_18171:371-631(+)
MSPQLTFFFSPVFYLYEGSLLVCSPSTIFLFCYNTTRLTPHSDFSLQLVDTENLTTLCVAVPKFNQKDWLENYETLAQFVVPRSSR